MIVAMVLYVVVPLPRHERFIQVADEYGGVFVVMAALLLLVLLVLGCCFAVVAAA